MTTATTRQPISSQCSPPENSFRRSAWNGVQRVGVLITLGRCPKHTSRPIEERPSPPHEAPDRGFGLSAHSLWEIQKRFVEVRGDSRNLQPQKSRGEATMSTIKQDAQAARARAIAEALQASGARSLMQLLAESERHKEHLDRLCAKLEALPKVVKKKTRQ